jgi:hypothetical protein
MQLIQPQSNNQTQLKPTNNLSLPHLIPNYQVHPLLMAHIIQAVDILSLLQVSAMLLPLQVEELAPRIQSVEEAAAL